jgi:hypothetical protein
MIGRLQRLKDNLPPPQDGVLLGIIVLVGTVSLLEGVVAPVIRRMYNIDNGAESDSISLEDYLGN